MRRVMVGDGGTRTRMERMVEQTLYLDQCQYVTNEKTAYMKSDTDACHVWKG